MKLMNKMQIQQMNKTKTKTGTNQKLNLPQLNLPKKMALLQGIIMIQKTKQIQTKEKNHPKKRKQKRRNNKEQSSQDGFRGESVGESTFRASTEKASDNKRGRAKCTEDSNSQKHKQNTILKPFGKIKMGILIQMPL